MCLQIPTFSCSVSLFFVFQECGIGSVCTAKVGSVPRPLEVHESIALLISFIHGLFKGDFDKICFAKFPSPSDCVAFVNAVQIKGGGAKGSFWAKPDRPIEERTAISVLWTIRKMLLGWGYRGSSVKVEENSKILKVGGKEVLTAAVQEFKLDLQWESTWAQWEALQGSAEYVQIKEGANEKLEKAREYSSKGKGKGKDH